MKYRWRKLTNTAQLYEGAVLKDSSGHKRTVLSINGNEVWMSHKGSRFNKLTGKTHPADRLVAWGNKLLVRLDE